MRFILLSLVAVAALAVSAGSVDAQHRMHGGFVNPRMMTVNPSLSLSPLMNQHFVQPRLNTSPLIQQRNALLFRQNTVLFPTSPLAVPFRQRATLFPTIPFTMPSQNNVFQFPTTGGFNVPFARTQFGLTSLSSGIWFGGSSIPFWRW
jgi:hypothetical protein